MIFKKDARIKCEKRQITDELKTEFCSQDPVGKITRHGFM